MTEPTADSLPTLDAIFREQASRVPAVEALRSAGRGVTYEELNRMSDAMAGHLVEIGVKPGSVVALTLPRSIEQGAALLGILKAGAAVLPLDRSYPRELVAYMLENSGATHTVDETFFARVHGRNGNGAPAVSSAGEMRCYILYTSGSTGRPKGVAMPHRTIANLVAWQQRTLPLRPGARVLQFAPLSFDVSFQEFFTTWADGGTLVLIDEATRHDPRALWRVIASEKVERIFLPYVALQMLAEHAPAEAPPRLRDVITAGEALRITPQIRSLFGRKAECRLHNHYGPTETHVCTAHTLQASAESWPLLPPIGEPIDATRVLLLDDNRQPANPGELHVGGACLAEGYVNRPDLTAERFLELEGGRFYRTGDLVRRVENGVLEFLGRADDQIKVRGFRVEPGEIEAQLSEHPAVRQCAVTARDHRLLAYWVGETVDPAELRRHLADRLAEHLLPSVFTRIETMPLTPSGKIDRRALPAPAAISSAQGAEWSGSEMERRIAAAWSKVLGQAVPNAKASFFDIGGTSLGAVEAQQLLGTELRRELPVTLLFQYPTIESLARHLEAGSDAGLAGKVSARAAAQRAALARRRSESANS